MSPVHVGALDAIHVASALSLERDLAAVATYDRRMQDALAKIEVEVLAPEGSSIPDPDNQGST